MKDLLAQWRQLEQQRKDEELIRRAAEGGESRRALTPRNFRRNNHETGNGGQTIIKRSPWLTEAHMRSQSCGPALRGRRRNVMEQDNDDGAEDATQRDRGRAGEDDIEEDEERSGSVRNSCHSDEEEEEQTYNRAAILAKFENLDAQAHRAVAALSHKKDFKWKVREPVTLSRPIGMRMVVS
jgi:hypothetical protein